MTKNFIALCKCKSVKKNGKDLIARFPFSGVFEGYRIKFIDVICSDEIVSGNVYLLALRLLEISGNNIVCRELKHRLL